MNPELPLFVAVNAHENVDPSGTAEPPDWTDANYNAYQLLQDGEPLWRRHHFQDAVMPRFSRFLGFCDARMLYQTIRFQQLPFKQVNSRCVPLRYMRKLFVTRKKYGIPGVNCLKSLTSGKCES